MISLRGSISSEVLKGRYSNGHIHRSFSIGTSSNFFIVVIYHLILVLFLSKNYSILIVMGIFLFSIFGRIMINSPPVNFAFIFSAWIFLGSWIMRLNEVLSF